MKNYRIPLIKEAQPNPRLNSAGQETLSDRPTTLHLEYDHNELTLKERMMLAHRDPSAFGAPFDDGDFDDSDFDAPTPEQLAHQATYTPHSEGFVDALGISPDQARKIAIQHGLIPPDTETSSPVVKTTKAKSAPIKQAPEPSDDTSGDDVA